jgi:ribosomal protein S18 acetylase RimI-like enzyme
MSLMIRRAEPADLETIGRVTLQAYVDGGHLHPESDYGSTLADARARAEDAELWVAVQPAAGTLLGSVTLAPPGSSFNEVAESGEAEVRMLAVSPDAQGSGAGEALMQHCVSRALELGLRALALSTQPSMHAAHRIYERLGFVRTPERDWSPIPGVDLITYRLDLTPMEAPD